MPQAFQSNFTSGEVTPLMGAKVDLAKYYTGCALLENMLILPFGGVVKRGGTKYIASAKHHDKTARLVRFEYSSEQAYALEFGEYYIRFYKDQGQIMSGGVPYEIATPSAPVPPAAPPGLAVTFTASASVFETGDVNRYLNYGVCRAKIVSCISATQVTADILINFPNTSPIASGSWSLRGTGIAETRYQPQYATNNYIFAEGSNLVIEALAGIDSWRSADVGKYFRMLGGLVKIQTLNTSQNITTKIIRE